MYSKSFYFQLRFLIVSYFLSNGDMYFYHNVCNISWCDCKMAKRVLCEMLPIIDTENVFQFLAIKLIYNSAIY